MYKGTIKQEWVIKSTLLSTYNIGWRRLSQWETEGFVRSVKFGEDKSSRRVYSTEDMEKTMSALAAGREPIRNAGRN